MLPAKPHVNPLEQARGPATVPVTSVFDAVVFDPAAAAAAVSVPMAAHPFQNQPLLLGHIRITVRLLLVRRIKLRLATSAAPHLCYPAALTPAMLACPVTFHPAPKSLPHAQTFVL